MSRGKKKGLSAYALAPPEAVIIVLTPYQLVIGLKDVIDYEKPTPIVELAKREENQ